MERMRAVTGSVIFYFVLTLTNGGVEGSRNYSLESEPSLGNETSRGNFSSNDTETIADKPAQSAERFIQSVHAKVVDMCRQLHDKSKAHETVVDRRTKIHVACVVLNQTGNKSTSWLIENAALREHEDSRREMRLRSESWKPCDDADEETPKNGSRPGKICYAAVEYRFPNPPDKADTNGPIIEAILVTDEEQRSQVSQEKVNRTGNLTTNSSEISDILRVLVNSSIPCGQTVENATEDSRICELSSRPNLNVDIVTCTCSLIGFYRVFYMSRPNTEHGFQWNGTENGVVFWMDFKYKEKVKGNKTDLEASLLSQLLSQLGYENSSLVDAVKLNLVPIINSNTTSAELTFWNSANTKRVSREAEMQFLTKLNQALATGSLNLTDGRRNQTRNFPIPIQRLQRITRDASGEDEDIDGLPGLRKDSVFLWFVFGIVMLMTLTLVIIGIRNHKRESADAVQAVQFHSVEELGLGMTGVQGSRRSSNGGGGTGEGVVGSARSMTTIISESSESGVQDEVRKIGSSSVGVGVHHFAPRGSPNPEERRPPSAFQVVVANDIVVTDEDELDRIHYMVPPPGDEDDEDDKSN